MPINRGLHWSFGVALAINFPLSNYDAESKAWGDVAAHHAPPCDGQPGFSQAGKVDKVTDTTVELLVQCDVIRRMVFTRSTGFDASGMGSFLVRPDAVVP
jgi:hypothetical protein